MKLTTVIIILLILFILCSTVVEKFVLTNNIPSGLSVTLSKGAQAITATVGSAFATDSSTLDPNTYYAVGTLNDAGKKAIADANAQAKNNGTTCSSFPDKLFIKLPATNAVCKTADSDLYSFAPDSVEACNKNINGVLYKQGSLKSSDTSLTLQDAYNGGKTCTQQLPATKDIACSVINAVCKTSDADLYTVPVDSASVCTILENGVWKKQGTLKPDASITTIPKVGSGKTCTEQYPVTKNIPCGPINAVCPVNDNTFYTFNPAVAKGSSFIAPVAPTIASVTSKMSESYNPGAFDAVIKVNVPASYANLGVTNYKVSVIDVLTNAQVNYIQDASIDSNNNLTVSVTHERQTDFANYSYYGGDYYAISRAMTNDTFNFDGTYKVTISAITSSGVIGPASAPVTFNSGYPSAVAMNAVYDMGV